jgi:hypothetical protein
MMKVVLMVLGAALFVAAPAFGASWHFVKSKGISGEFAVTSFSANVRHPLVMKIRLQGAIDSGDVVVSCSRGFSISSYSRSYSGAGTHMLPVRPRRAGSCDVIVSIGVSGGSGRASLYVYR